ncbi:MAG: lecithin retinol acyltransferase family protein [Pseudomonadota bacterium]
MEICKYPNSKRMLPGKLLPGDIVAVRYPMYKHLAIVSDQLSTFNGQTFPNLISLSYRTGTVQEEPWHSVVGNKVVERSTISGNKSSRSVLSRARTCMQLNIQYDLLTFNCEHFVRYACGLSVESVQIKNAFYGTAIGVASCLLLPKVTLTRFALLATTGAIASLRHTLNKI